VISVPDIKCSSSIEKEEILQMLHKLPSHFNHMKMKKFYTSGIALYTKRGRSFIVYDKEEETGSNKSNFRGYDCYKGVIRIEYRYTKNNIRTISNSHNITPTLKEFVTEEIYNKYFIEEVSKYFFKADFRDLRTTKQIIKNSNYALSLKKKLISYVNNIYTVNFDNVSKKMSPNTMKLYNEILSSLNINPLTTISSSYMDGLYKRILEKSKDYFKEEN
jgi:hypothetical protein